MSAGLQTRNKLHAALHPDIHGDIVDVPQPAEEAAPRSSAIKNMTRSDPPPPPPPPPCRSVKGDTPKPRPAPPPLQNCDDEDIPEVMGQRHGIPLRETYLPNAHGLGTPLEAERTRAIRREQLYDKAFRIGGAIIVILVAMGGYGYMGRRDQPVSSGVAYYVKAQGLRVGSRACELDQHEGCLVCMHKDVDGMALVSHHC